jgi:peptide/nickel transport system substrate-binding protein
VRLKFERLSVWYIAWNQKDNPFFSDYRVRRAMIHALDRETFIERALDGLGVPGATTYHPKSSWTDPEVRPWPYDPQEARRLLAAAGWSDGDGDGILDRDGVPFRFTMMIPRTTQEIADRIAVWTQQSLAEIGVAMEIEFLEWRAYRERRNDRRFQAAMATLSFSPVPDQYELYHSSAAEDGYNFFGLVDPEVDRLLELGRTTFDTGERMEIYHRLQRRLHELEPLTCMFHFSVPVLHRKEIHGIRPSPIDFYRTWPGPRAWRWEQEVREEG